ncbi:carboxylate-amine ligase [Aeromicrobium massiliense]|uniref:carboxylate-amine ligase n=1 Tax=Aeromicrobium massiliense TaxID=1464554 RepID=UPI0006766B60|nr:YbdK family carboxylate-amine ligase [Aeromicrobium massiliense]
MLTIGVEEELLVLDPQGRVLPVAPQVVRLADDPRVKTELMTYQVETVSSVCTDLDQLGRELAGLRRTVADAAARADAMVVASGTPPVGEPGLEMVTDSRRYRGLAGMFPDAVATGGTCACQVHVGVEDRDLAVDVLARLRPWLPALLALGTNSPLGAGRDTGWSSSRYARQLRWPSFVPPSTWPSAAAYDAALDDMIRRGTAFDLRSVYLLARLSPRYPTIEIRVADTALEVADAVLLAGVCRALVATLVADARQGVPVVPVGDQALRADLLDVAVHGDAPTLDAGSDTLHVGRLRHRIGTELTLSGDAGVVLAGLDRLAAEGTGAQRQRRLLDATVGSEGLVAALAAVTSPEATGPGTVAGATA